MRGIIKFSLGNKLAIFLMALITIIAGVASGATMKMESYPSMAFPTLMIMTPYPGASPEVVEEEVTIPIENAVRGMSGVESVSSSSMTSGSFVQVQFDYDVDMNYAEMDVQKAIDKIEFPEGVEPPEIMQFNTDQAPILVYGVGSTEQDLAQLTEEVEENIVPAIEAVDGVQSVDVYGTYTNEVEIIFDEEALAMAGHTVYTATSVVESAVAEIPLGVYEMGTVEEAVVVDGNVVSLEDLKAIQIPKMPVEGVPFVPGYVSLEDVATVEIVGQADSIARTNGEPAITLMVKKTTEGNAVEIAHDIDDELAAFEESIDGIEFTTAYDSATPVEDSIEVMVNKAIFGAFIAAIIILAFLRNGRTTLIAVISIPLSLLIALWGLNRLDQSLNMMTLGAMTVAIGRVIDDSIVVIENVFRRMSDKNETLKGAELIREATLEVFKPILSSTLVTIAVFIPIAVVGGMVGQMFMPFAIAVSISLLASLLIAVTVVPALTHLLFRNGVPAKMKHDENHKGKMALAYRAVLDWSLRRKWIPIIVSLIMLSGSLALIPKIGINLMSSEDSQYVYLTFEPHPGQTLEAVDAEMQKAEDIFLAQEEVESVQISVGGSNSSEAGSNKTGMITVCYEEDTENFAELREDAMNELYEVADPAVGEWIDVMSASGSKIEYVVYGNSVDELTSTVTEIEQIMLENENLENVSTSLSEAYTEYTLVVDQEKAAAYGVSATAIAMELLPNMNKTPVATITENGQEISVYVTEEDVVYNSIDDILEQEITSIYGTKVAIGDVVTVEEGTTSDTISHKDGKIYATVSANPTTEDISQVSMDIQEEVEKIDPPSGVSIEQAGVAADTKEAFAQLGAAMLAAIAIIYLILVITFRGGLAPLAIMFSLPFTVIGALVGLYLTDNIIEVTVLIGMLMLIGIVVTNAIVLVDKVVYYEEQGLSTRDAILEAGTMRLRPILMTAIATIGALLPLAVSSHGAGIISQGLAVTVIGGLISSTLLTLIIVPIAYELLSKLKRKPKAE